MRRIGVGSPEKLAAAHSDNDRTPDIFKQAGLGAIADDPSSWRPASQDSGGEPTPIQSPPVVEGLLYIDSFP